MGVQQRLAAHFRRPADEAEDRTNLDAWAVFVEALPDDNEHVLAIARAQRELDDPDRFTPRGGDGRYLRQIAAGNAPTAHLLRRCLDRGPAGTVGVRRLAKQGPPPEREGVPH